MIYIMLRHAYTPRHTPPRHTLAVKLMHPPAEDVKEGYRAEHQHCEF